MIVDTGLLDAFSRTRNSHQDDTSANGSLVYSRVVFLHGHRSDAEPEREDGATATHELGIEKPRIHVRGSVRRIHDRSMALVGSRSWPKSRQSCTSVRADVRHCNHPMQADQTSSLPQQGDGPHARQSTKNGRETHTHLQVFRTPSHVFAFI